MTRVSRAAALLCVLVPLSAKAQQPPGGLPTGGTPTGEEEEKPEGAAEKAPDTGQLPSFPPLPPWPGQKKKRFELLQLDGYFRMRADWLSNLHLGFHDLGNGTPFREPLTCREMTPVDVRNDACGGSIGTANLRLRLEPTINLSEDVTIHMQVDVLDNLVLGSTPDGEVFGAAARPANIPVNAFTGGQVEPEAGRNFSWDSIRVKRAWAEVYLAGLGLLRFGRMPSQWGLGVLANGGGFDPYHNTYCLDCDFGDTADRIIWGLKIPGTPLRAAVGYDWVATGPNAAQTDVYLNRFDGQPWDMDDADDITQWVFVLGKFDGGDEWRDAIERDELAWNVGAYGVYRTQSFDARNVTFGSTTPETAYVPRDAWAAIPDLWFRIGKRNLLIEGELVLVVGNVESLADVTSMLVNQDIFQWGGVLRASQILYKNKLLVGFEVGTASGDQWEPLASGTTNVRDAPFVPQNPTTDSTISNFRFDFDYHVDLILFRELLGTVTNATYLKPHAHYDITDRFRASAAGIFSFANIMVSTPGNDAFYGIELDADIGYHNEEEGFFAGLSYGVFFPMGAMDHPGPPIFPVDEEGSADTAQTFQARLILTF